MEKNVFGKEKTGDELGRVYRVSFRCGKNMNEKINVERTTPYGFKLTDGTFREADEKVRKFAARWLPCELEILEYEGIKISKVAVVKSTENHGETTHLPADFAEKERKIIREVAIKCAVRFLADDPKEEKERLFELAQKIEEWILR